MQRTITKIFLGCFIVSAGVWLYALSMKNYRGGELLEFGTVQFVQGLDSVRERSVYADFAQLSIIAFISYPLAILSAFGFLRSSSYDLKEHGWLMMSAILLFVFVPVELWCFWLDWKIIGLHYWGEWPLEEFRKAFLARITALAGLPFIALLCYCTIPIIAVLRPFTKRTS